MISFCLLWFSVGPWLGTLDVTQGPAPSAPSTVNVAMYLPFCIPGVGGTIPCPCNNPPAGGGLGCDNFGAGPAASGTLQASGTNSLANDSILLQATGENATSLTVFWQGADPTMPAGVVHGAGVRCVQAALHRLYVGTCAGGAIARPGSGDPGVSERSARLGDTIPVGATRHYFDVYRDPSAAGPCANSGSTVNLTNAVTITWGP